MKAKKTFTIQNKSWLITLFILAILLVSSVVFTRYKKGVWEKDVRLYVQDLLSSKKSNLEKALYSRIYYTRGVAAYVSLNPEISQEEYAQLAKEYIRNDSVINSMALSKDCIISDIYPLKGHEAALGLNLLEHPERRIMVQKTIATHASFVAGPLELIEGGIAFISYTPIFNKERTQSEHFWGVTDIVILRDRLFAEAGLLEQEKDFDFALRGKDGTGVNGPVFWGNPEVFEHNPVCVNVDLPIGNWVLAARPIKGWEAFSNQDNTLLIFLIISAIIISILVGLWANVLLKLHRNEKELKAIFASLDSLILELNREGEYLKIVKTNTHLLYLPEHRLVGGKINEIFDKETADIFMQAIQKCFRTKELVIIEYPLLIDGEERWFVAHISHKTKDSVIFNATDITQAKAREKELKEVNKTKDTFLSIIAHDLRGPLSSQKSLIEILLNNFKRYSDEKKTHFLQNLQESSTDIYNLLENLLKWTMSQSGRIDINNERINVNDTYQALIRQMKKTAQLKGIHLAADIDSEHHIWADKHLTEVILRNLIANAIKYTAASGNIHISSSCVSINNKDYIKISVNDTGLGISDQRLKKIFTLQKSKSTRGTDNEKGSGLGLLLCKEFTDKQDGILEVASIEGKGSTFSFALPRA